MRASVPSYSFGAFIRPHPDTLKTTENHVNSVESFSRIASPSRRAAAVWFRSRLRGDSTCRVSYGRAQKLRPPRATRAIADRPKVVERARWSGVRHFFRRRAARRRRPDEQTQPLSWQRRQIRAPAAGGENPGCQGSQSIAKLISLAASSINLPIRAALNSVPTLPG